jgi:flagellar hook-length control protein FliK
MNATPPAAPTPQDVAPQRVAPPPSPAVGTAFDQLLTIGLATPQQAGQSNTPSPPNTAPKSKTNTDDPNAANAAAAVPAPAPQVLQAITVTSSSGAATVAAAALPTPVVKPPGLTAANGPDPTAGGNQDPNGAATKLPPGAAELQARIVAGAPSFLSQPNAALAGLWHHVGESATATPGQPGSPSSAAANAASDATATASQTQLQAQANDVAALAKNGTDQPLVTPGIELAQAASADSSKSGTAAPLAADPSNVAAVSLPGPADATAVTPQATSADPALASPGQIAPAWEQVAINLRQAAQSGSDRIEIQLKPASLGAIAVKLDVSHDGHITAVISADRSDTLNLLRQHSDGLTQSLRDAGLQADSGSLSFNLRGDSQSFAQGPAPAVQAMRSDDAVSLPSARAELPRYRQHAGAVDIEV